MKTILNGIIKENPVFVLLLGLCSTLAVTTNFEASIMMGICLTIVLTISNFIISVFKSFVPDNVKIPVYILIIGTIVTILESLLKKYLPDLYQILGIYLPLIVVNCIVLGRAMSVASKQSVKKSILDGIGVGMGYMFSLMLVSFFRELLGTGKITIIDSLSKITGSKIILNIFNSNEIFPINLFITPAGAFLTVGFLMAIFNYLQSRRKKIWTLLLFLYPVY